MIFAAFRLVAKHGAAGCSMAQIGIEAGYSRGLPQARFGSKKALLEAVIDASEEWFERAVKRRLGSATGLEAAFLRAETHMRGAMTDAPGTAAIYQLYVESIGAAEDLNPRMRALGENYRLGFRRHLQEALDSGEIAPDTDIDRTATVILGAVRGMIIQSLVDRGQTDLVDAMDHLKTLIRIAIGNGAASDRPAPG